MSGSKSQAGLCEARVEHSTHFDEYFRTIFEIWQDTELHYKRRNALTPLHGSGISNETDRYDFWSFIGAIQQSTIDALIDESNGATRSKEGRPKTNKDLAMIVEDWFKFKGRDNFQNRNLSPTRLMSENSTDSDDNFIVFQDESDADSMTDSTVNAYEPEVALKVRFNDIPIVHHMIKWNYAYRAARKGPWEQMAQNRERFRRRINHIASVLNPILTCQHRTRIWQERFVPLWEEMARNRENCERCLNCIIYVINQILMNQHRIHIWQQRFAREP